MKHWVILISSILAVLLTISLAEGAHWKLYAKDAPLERGITGNAYYDKDSIGYPFETKGLFGMKKDKSIKSVWVEYLFPQSNREMKLFSYVYCDQRQITLKSIISDGHYIYPDTLGQSYGIEPNTTDEKLYRIICR